jgi:DNA-binding response OmpR family regulator
LEAKKTILVIEDEPHIALGLKDALEFEGFRVVAPRTASRA